MKHLAPLSLALASLVSLAACGSGGSATTEGGGGQGASSASSGGGGAGTGSGTGASSTSSGTGASSTSSGTGASSTSSGTGASSTSSGTGGGMVADPNQDGPYTYAELDDTINVAATGDNVDIHCAYPTGGPSNGPYPVIVFGHGFSLPTSQYTSYLKRLASFGYVAIAPDYPGSIFDGVNNVGEAKDMIAALDWSTQKPELAGKADANNAGMSGHSLGGKVALLAATSDARVKASVVLDPVNSSMNCSPQDCPDVAAMMPSLNIPTGFVGQVNSMGTSNDPSCAPDGSNFTAFYAKTNAPSLAVSVLDAGHMSFIDDTSPGVCLQCFVCKSMNLAPHDQVLALSHAYVVAFYERHLRGNVAYDTYLTGAEAQARYVQTNQATIQSK